MSIVRSKLINKKDLARRLSRKTLLTIAESIDIIGYLFEEIMDQLIEGAEISIVNFGKFYIYKRKQRPVRNPRTMQEYTLDPVNTIKFKPSIYIKSIIKDTQDIEDFKEENTQDNEAE
jgi:nucleoid DNA-binding protein